MSVNYSNPVYGNRPITFMGMVFRETGTGGGNTALEHHAKDGTYWIITDGDLSSPDYGCPADVAQFAHENDASEAMEPLQAFHLNAFWPDLEAPEPQPDGDK